MTATDVFTAIHANLDFSALPERDVPRVLDCCYWPLLRIAEERGVPLGIEMPARTLRRLEREDPDWLKSFLGLHERGAIELIGSGRAQLIGPLVPVDVNRENLSAGAREYEEIVGHVPTTWFVSEQTYSTGLAELYAECGASALVMEWNNPATHRAELRSLRTTPARLRAGSTHLSLLWNDSVIFQRLQRVVHGTLPEDDHHRLLAKIVGDHRGSRALCVYGGDLEIFDYRPGGQHPTRAADGLEMQRLGRCLARVSEDPRFAWRLPRQVAVAAAAVAAPIVELCAAAEPLQCKKQPRYNPTRWAASGRDGLAMNRRCFALRRSLRAVEALESGLEPGAFERLVDLWRSDLRTRATEEKVAGFQEEWGVASAAAAARLAECAPERPQGFDAVLSNPWNSEWLGEIVEIPLQLRAGRGDRFRVVASRAAALPPGASQVEVVDRHRDGSARRVRMVLAPRLGVGETLALRLEAESAARPPGVEVSADEVATETVRARFLPGRGGALAGAWFEGIAPGALVGTLPHGSFDEVEYTPDFYSGHVVAHSEEGDKLTSLAPARLEYADGEGALRANLSFRVSAPHGDWITHYRIYRDRPRLDCSHELELRGVRLRTLRLGTLTWLPDSFDRTTLAYQSVNGGACVEHFPLQPGVRVDHAASVSPMVTARSCVGATEGWISAGDQRHGVAAIGERAEAAVVPMVEFADVDDAFLLRVFHTAAETDETRASFLRGTLRVPMAIVAHANDLEAVRGTASAIERGLISRTERTVGITRTL